MGWACMLSRKRPKSWWPAPGKEGVSRVLILTSWYICNSPNCSFVRDLALPSGLKLLDGVASSLAAKLVLALWCEKLVLVV